MRFLPENLEEKPILVFRVWEKVVDLRGIHDEDVPRDSDQELQAPVAGSKREEDLKIASLIPRLYSLVCGIFSEKGICKLKNIILLFF